MSLTSIGLTAMSASYAALQTASNNIANANTKGYSRQQAQLADAPSQYTGSGFVGSGVVVSTVSRSYDKFLTSQALATTSTSAADAARQDKLTQLESVFPIGENGVGSAAGQFLNAFVDVANNPSDSSSRQVVLSQSRELASRFAAAGSQLTTLQIGVTQDVKATVAKVNAAVTQVAKLNQQIASLQGTGADPNQLLDERDQLIGQIGQAVNITTITADDGSIGLFVGGGQSLVLGSNVSTLQAVADSFDPSRVQLGLTSGAKTQIIPPASLSGGSIAGLLRFQNDDLTTAQNLLGQMATAISGAVNTQQSLGLDLGQPAGAGVPVFSVGTARVLNASTNSGNAQVGVTVADAAAVQASDYLMSFDGSQYLVTRQSDQKPVDGSPFSPADLAAGVVVDGLTLQLASGTANPGDRFLLQPVATAAQNMKSVLDKTDGIAAASPFTGSTNVDNTGTASIASLTAVDPAYSRGLTAAIQFSTASGDYDWSLNDANGNSVDAGSSTWAPGTPIALNGFALSLNGVPRSGDRITVTPTVAVTANNGNAVAMAAMAERPIVGVSTTSPGADITDAYASALANIGVRVQAGQTAASISNAAATEAATAKSNGAGVNLDEEAAKLIQYQQSYQAAAKILQVAQTIFQSMLQMAAG